MSILYGMRMSAHTSAERRSYAGRTKSWFASCLDATGGTRNMQTERREGIAEAEAHQGRQTGTLTWSTSVHKKPLRRAERGREGRQDDGSGGDGEAGGDRALL